MNRGRLSPVPAILLAASLLGGCAGPRPVLYPNPHLRAVGEAQAERDIAQCEALAEAAGADGAARGAESAAGSAVAGGAIGAAGGAAGGAVVGNAGRGAAVGAASGAAASFVRSLFRSRGPSPAYQSFVVRCLRERGYEPVGWN